MILPLLLKKKQVLEPDVVIGTPSGIYTINSFTYPSTIDSISNLYAKYAYDDGLTNLPIVILMHGYGESGGYVASFVNSVFTRFASYGYFICAVAKRGRDGGGGTRDSSGRETYDILDAINYIKTNYSGRVNPNKISFIGYSGGGMDALGCAAKLPDLFDVIVNFFGISDLAAWHTQEPGAQPTIELYVGGSPATVPLKYAARKFKEAALLNSLAYIYCFHDEADSAVEVSHSDLLNNYAVSIGRQLEYNRTTSANSPRWYHGLPNSGDLILAETYFKQKVHDFKCPALPLSGTLQINGFVKTKQFEIRVGNMDDHVAMVNYNLTSKTFEVITTESAAVVVYFQNTQQNFTVNGSHIFNF